MLQPLQLRNETSKYVDYILQISENTFQKWGIHQIPTISFRYFEVRTIIDSLFMVRYLLFLSY